MQFGISWKAMKKADSCSSILAQWFWQGNMKWVWCDLPLLSPQSPLVATLSYLLFWFLRQSHYVASPGWPQTCSPPALVSWVLGLQACTTPNHTKLFSGLMEHFCISFEVFAYSYCQGHWSVVFNILFSILGCQSSTISTFQHLFAPPWFCKDWFWWLSDTPG
jgi:hypothetical protein